MGRSSNRESATVVRQTIQVDGTWDIETQEWTTFVAGALYRPGQETKVFGWRKEDDFVSALLACEGETLWAHNGGRFDTLWLLGHVIRRGLTDFRIGLSGSAVASLEVCGVTFRDSMRLVPMSLRKASGMFGGALKQRLGLECTCGAARCEGYCRIRRDMSIPDERRMREYLVADCKSLYDVLDGLCTYAERHDLDLRPTIGSSAWATVERQGVARADWSNRRTSAMNLYRAARAGYYGGRTQVFRPKSARGFHYDIHSAYPAALSSLCLPVGERRELFDDEASRAYADGKLGIFRGSVHVPECFLPPLPVRTRLRSAYPVGHFAGSWTGAELQTAQLRGATVGRIKQAVVWSDGEMVLAPFCRHVWSLRDQAGTKTPLGTWLKLYANSLTGKLAMRPESEHIIGPERARPCAADFPCGGYCDPTQCCEHQPCRGTCGATPPLGSIGLGLFKRKSYHLAHCSHVEWAAYLTAFTRTQLLTFAGDGEDAVYCDTDSLFCTKEKTWNVGPSLGQWGLEDRYHQFVAIAPKTYRYRYRDEGRWHVVAASKGIPDAVENFDRLFEGVTVDRGVLTFKQAVQAGDLFTRKNLTRRLRGDGKHFGDRILDKDGRTYPQTVRQISDEEWELASNARS